MKKPNTKFYILLQKNGNPIQSLDKECLVFSTRKGALDKKREMIHRGERHIYGRDEFNAKDIVIGNLI